MTDTTQEEPYVDLGRGLLALQDSGMLYLLNSVLMPQGYQAMVAGNELRLYGDGRHVRTWPEDLVRKVEDGSGAVETARRRAKQSLLDAERDNWAARQTGHSPGFGGKTGVPVSQVPGAAGRPRS